MRNRILHIATENFAGVPYSLVRAERLLGMESDLITISKPIREHPQEESLNLPFYGGIANRFVRRITKSSGKLINKRFEGEDFPPVWSPRPWGKILFNIRDKIWEYYIRRKGFPDKLNNYDIIVLDGGVGFLRSGKFIRQWIQKTNRLVTIFYGDDLRRRGVIKEIDDLSQLVFTFEFDHTLIHPRANFLFFPFFAEEMPQRQKISSKIRIGHSPTNRNSKGTIEILKVFGYISNKYTNVKIVIIEGLNYHESLQQKSTLDIFVDQVGELGYGISSLEAMAMGIPSVVELMPDFEKFLGYHPFVNADISHLAVALEKLIESEQLRQELGDKGREWVYKVHDPLKSASEVLAKYEMKGWV